MGLMTTLRERMTIVLWLLLFFFLLSMSIGGLVGGANIIDQIVGRVDPNRVIAQINGQDISPDYFNNLVNQQIDQARSSGQQVNDMMYDRARSAAWDNLLQQILVSSEIERLDHWRLDPRSWILGSSLKKEQNRRQYITFEGFAPG